MSRRLDDLRSRLANRVQLTTDGHRAYFVAVHEAFGGDVDYAMLVKLYGEPKGKGEARRYSAAECCGIRRRVVEGKPVENLGHAVALHFMFYNLWADSPDLARYPGDGSGAYGPRLEP